MSALAEKPKIFGTLVTDVVRKNLCVFCGACVASCPISALSVQDEEPTIKGKCVLCQICYYQCPRVSYPTEELEKYVFGRAKSANEPLGIYRSCYVGRSTKEDVLKKCQDGGVVTSVLAHALESNQIDCAVVSGLSPQQPWRPMPIVVRTFGDLVVTAGTKYTPSPTLMGLGSAVEEYGCGKVAMVGVPCQIQALRRMQTSPLGDLKLANAAVLAIGLFCMESYYYGKLVNGFLKEKQIDPVKVSRFAIKKGKFRIYMDGNEVLSVPLKELDGYVRHNCHVCGDFTAELADLSVGGVGGPDGWSTILARTERGEGLLLGAQKAGFLELKPISEVKPGLDLVMKLSDSKKPKPVAQPSAGAGQVS